jgi:hypothetical protein
VEARICTNIEGDLGGIIRRRTSVGEGHAGSGDAGGMGPGLPEKFHRNPKNFDPNFPENFSINFFFAKIQKIFRIFL